MALLEVRKVTKIYHTEGAPVTAVQDVTFDLEPGQFIALVGRSGCGKSTLLNLCGAMDFPTSGEVRIEGQITTGFNDAEITRLRREKVGFVFQSFQLLHTLTAIENVQVPLLLARNKDARRTALERLRWVEMHEYGDRFPHQLSGGQQQRVAIARALVHNPRLVLADEPTGNLDSVTGEIVLQTLRGIAGEFGAAVMMATHSAESAAIADHVLYMKDGRLEPAMALP